MSSNRALSRLSLAVPVLVGTLAATVCFAQPIHATYPSLEWLVAWSDVIVRAAVADVAREVPQDQFPFPQ